MKHLIAVVAVAAILPGAASALSFSGSFGVSGNALSDPGLVVETYPSSGNFAFDLDDGESTSFKLFRIWTGEGSVGSDDLVPNDLSVGFSVNGASGPIGGTVTGHTEWYSFLNAQWGSLTFGTPIDLDVGTGILSVALSGIDSFNKGLYGLWKGKDHGGDVYADFSYQQASPSAVPLPAGFGLMAAGLVALGAAARRRKAA